MFKGPVRLIGTGMIAMWEARVQEARSWTHKRHTVLSG